MRFSIKFCICFFLIIICFNQFLYSSITETKEELYREMVMEGRRLSEQDGLYLKSVKKLEDALIIGKDIYGENSISLGPAYFFLSISYQNLGVLDKALKNAYIAENLFIKRWDSNHNNVATVYSNIGSVYEGKVNYIEALQFYYRALNIYTNKEELDRNKISKINYKIARVHYLLDQYDESINICKRNLNNSTSEDLSDYYNLIAVNYHDLKNYKNAQTYYNKSLILTIKNAESETDISIAREYLSYALFLIDFEKFEESKEYLKKAFSIISLTEKETGENLSYYFRLNGVWEERQKVSSSHFNRQEKEKRKKHLLNAINYYNKALLALNFPANYLQLQNLDSLNCISNLESVDILSDKADAFVQIAAIFKNEDAETYQNSLENAVINFQFTGNFINRLRKEITGDDNKIQLSSLQSSTFNEIIKTSFQAYKTSKNKKYLAIAFENAERIKSGSVFEKLSDQLALQNSLVPSEILEREQMLNAEISKYSQEKYIRQDSNTPNTTNDEEIDSTLFVLRHERNQLVDSLEINFPEYYKEKYGKNSLTISQIQNKLKDNEVLIEYVLNETDSIPELYAFKILKNSLDFINLEPDSQFIDNVKKVFYFTSDPKYQFIKNKDIVEFCISSNLLYKTLILPFKEEIANKKLIIIPDGKLNYISFDALLEDIPDTTTAISFNKLQYLIKSNSINYSYSSNLLYGLESNKKIKVKNVLAFAPEYKNDSIQIKGKMELLPPLAGTLKEVELISEILGTKSFTGNNATVTNFLSNYSTYDVLHLAMHAYIDDSIPALSKFAFSQRPVDASKTILTTGDIYGLKLNARLAVLSACNTGSGKLQSGEGVMSLARGFLYAGCPAILMTLWEVEDNSGSQIMNSFYKYLKKGKKKDDALRLAKLDYLENANSRLAHPHYWLGYVNIGDNSALYKSYDFYFFSLLLLVIVGISAEQIIKRQKTKKF